MHVRDKMSDVFHLSKMSNDVLTFAQRVKRSNFTNFGDPYKIDFPLNYEDKLDCD